MPAGLANYFKRLSPTKVNGFLDWRSKWFLEDIMQRRLPPTPEMKRGNAVEVGICEYLLGRLDMEQAQAHAAAIYAQETADLDVDDVAECALPLPALVEAGVKALEPYGKIVSIQRAVSGQIPDTIIDWFGKADIEFENGVVVDLKVTGKTPSKMSHGHSRQGSYYQKFIPGCTRTDFVYLIPLKKGVNTVTHTVKDVDKHIADLRLGALAMHKVLSISDNPEDLKEFFIPAPGDWWLAEPMAMSMASEVWGISMFEEEKVA